MHYESIYFMQKLRKNIKNYTQLLRVLFLIVTQKLRETVEYQ